MTWCWNNIKWFQDIWVWNVIFKSRNYLLLFQVEKHTFSFFSFFLYPLTSFNYLENSFVQSNFGFDNIVIDSVNIDIITTEYKHLMFNLIWPSKTSEVVIPVVHVYSNLMICHMVLCIHAIHVFQPNSQPSLLLNYKVIICHGTLGPPGLYE